MARLHRVLEELLVEAGALKTIEMGPPSAKSSATPEVKDGVMERLLGESKFNNRFLKAVITLHFLIFTVALWLVYYSKDSLAAFSVILGISVTLLLGVVRSLSSLWQTKMGIDILIAILPSLSPEQSVKVVKDIYYNQSKLAPGSGVTTKQPKL